MVINLNGQTEVVPDRHTLRDLIEQRKPRPPFAVEINKRLVQRHEYDRTPLKDQDEVEIVTLVGGG